MITFYVEIFYTMDILSLYRQVNLKRVTNGVLIGYNFVDRNIFTVIISKSNGNNGKRFKVRETSMLQTSFESFQVMTEFWWEMFLNNLDTFTTCYFTESYHSIIQSINAIFVKLTLRVKV